MTRFGLALALIFAGIGSAQAEPDAAMLAGSCANCHGPDGAGAGLIPALRGRPEGELLAQLRAFRSGALPATIMGRLTKGYSDAQLALLAQYFSARR